MPKERSSLSCHFYNFVYLTHQKQDFIMANLCPKYLLNIIVIKTMKVLLASPHNSFTYTHAHTHTHKEGRPKY